MFQFMFWHGINIVPSFNLTGNLIIQTSNTNSIQVKYLQSVQINQLFRLKTLLTNLFIQKKAIIDHQTIFSLTKI